MSNAADASIEVEKQEVSSCAIAEYSPIAAALAIIEEKFAGAVFDVATKAGMEMAKTARAEIRGYQTNLEAVRVSIKAPALQRCREIDSEAKEIDARLAKVRAPIEAQIKMQEAAAEAEKQAKLQAEIERINGIRARIADIERMVDFAAFPAATSATCQEWLIDAKKIVIDESFGELADDAAKAKELTVFRLQNMLAEKLNAEAEAARIKAEREELDRLRAEDAKRRATEEARLEREAAAAQARREAEDKARREAQEYEDACRREAQAQEDAARRAAAKIEQDRIDALRAQERREQDERDRLAREELAAEQARIDARAAEVRRQEQALADAQRAKDDAEAAERRRQEAALAAADRQMREAAPVMLDALRVAVIAMSDFLSSEFLARSSYAHGDADEVANLQVALQFAKKAAADGGGLNYYRDDGVLVNLDGSRSIFDDVDK